MSDKDYGLKIGPQGQNVQDTPDHELLFNSSWHIPKIVMQGTVSGLAPQVTHVIPHTLGYVPMVITWWERRPNTRQLSIFRFEQPLAYTSNSEILLYYNTGLANPPVNVSYKVFAIDIEEDFSAPIIQDGGVGVEPQVEPDYGMKVSLPGKDVGSSDTRDFSIHTNFRSPQIHKVVTGVIKPGDNLFEIPHNLGYPPMYFFYFDNDTGYYEVVIGSGDTWSTSATDTHAILSFHNFTSNDMPFSAIILKDPFKVS